MAKLTVTSLQQMKRDGQKIMAAVCYDYQLSKILDRAAKTSPRPAARAWN